MPVFPPGQFGRRRHVGPRGGSRSFGRRARTTVARSQLARVVRETHVRGAFTSSVWLAVSRCPRVGLVSVCALRCGGARADVWSRDLSAWLTLQLAGHPAVGHLRLNDVVQGSEIVLKGVASAEASSIPGSVERAVDAVNADCADGEDVGQTGSVRQGAASAIAGEVGANQRRPDPGTPT